MIPLSGVATRTKLAAPLSRSVWMIAGPMGPRDRRAFIITDPTSATPEGFDLYLGKTGCVPQRELPAYLELPLELGYLAPGDVVSVSPDGRRVRVLWRLESHHNSVLLTERCGNHCLMCAQPPRDIDDDWRLGEAVELLRLLPISTKEINFSGGEPTLYGDRLIRLLRLCRNLLPEAEVHVLSNGRAFAQRDYADAWARIDNPRMMVGIPIYGPEPTLHDFVVQSRGAFDDTVRGVLDLAQLQQRIEIRVVLHQQTAPAIVEIAEFISRNLPFVDQVALMGLEMIGLARANLKTVWVDPFDYREALTDAIVLLDRKGIRTVLYNHQLCLIERTVWPFAVKSISDWKREYLPECLGCSERERCGGFFVSAKYRVSDHVKAIHLAGDTGGGTTSAMARTHPMA